MTTSHTPEETVSLILSLYTKYGNFDYIGESITQLEHALQAGFLAIQNITPGDEFYEERDEIIVAAFLHDIGHILDLNNESSMNMITDHNENLGRLHHELIGAKFLRENEFPPSIYKLVEGHVNAKRYNISKYPEYRDRLSPASLKTLEFQGGLMSDDEMTEFEADEYFDKLLLLRTFDDNAKDTKFLTTKGYNSLQQHIFNIMLDVLENYKLEIEIETVLDRKLK
jgi:putative nucleotidyltransferase with HDIG domain